MGDAHVYKIIVQETLAQWCNLDNRWRTTRYASRREAMCEAWALKNDCEEIDPSTAEYVNKLIKIVEDA
jgi:hypothetical protein